MVDLGNHKLRLLILATLDVELGCVIAHVDLEEDYRQCIHNWLKTEDNLPRCVRRQSSVVLIFGQDGSNYCRQEYSSLKESQADRLRNTEPLHGDVLLDVASNNNTCEAGRYANNEPRCQKDSPILNVGEEGAHNSDTAGNEECSGTSRAHQHTAGAGAKNSADCWESVHQGFVKISFALRLPAVPDLKEGGADIHVGARLTRHHGE